MSSDPRLICLIGAECTGKTTLAQALAAQLGGLWVPEYLRAFTAEHGRTPDRTEQLHILQRQVHLETAALAAARQQRRHWVVCDTAPLLTAVYSDCVFSDVSLYPQAHGLHARYALTLLLEPDLPWVADGLQRDGTAVRAAVQARIEGALRDGAWPFVRIAGTGEARVQAALDAVLSVTH
ncbi:MAG: ATP-binding protein [Burkholderiaceae bacterium]|nr:ATP-binding protein [Burkholderiaceae bacterium]